ncbi:MAG TPA: sigma-70 family RNA polymerase sigma factor [Terracidiphilus sp.]|jgi:RNA polymerase sigma-70 factor (ECF subfamily)
MSGSPSEQASLLRPEEPGASQSARLILAISQGNRDAEQEFAERYMPPVRAMLMARLRDPDLAADLKQDVMIEALCALRKGQIQDPEKLSQFVYGIARNCLNNYFRSSRRVTAVELPEELPDLSDNTEQRELHDREQSALRAIESLDRIDRAILQMTLVDGLKPGAIADQLRLNPDVVRQRKLRATRRVTEFLRRESQKSSVVHIHAGGPK